MRASGWPREVPQALRDDGYRTYRCYRRGPDGVHEFPTRGPGARCKATRTREQASTGPGQSTGPPRVRYVLDRNLLPSYCHADCVEAVGRTWPAVFMNPAPGRGHHQSSLGPAYRLQQRAAGRGRAGLDLHERHDAPPRHHQIDLPGAGAEVAGKYRPPPRGQMRCRQRFSTPPEVPSIRCHRRQGDEGVWAMEWLDGTIYRLHWTRQARPSETARSRAESLQTRSGAATPTGSGSLPSDRSIALAIGTHCWISCSNCSG